MIDFFDPFWDGFGYEKSIKIDEKSIEIDKFRGKLANMRSKTPKRATRLEKRGNKGAIPIVGSTIRGARGPWPGGRGVQLNDQKPRI